MTIKSEEQNHLPALDGALMGDHSPGGFFQQPQLGRDSLAVSSNEAVGSPGPLASITFYPQV